MRKFIIGLFIGLFLGSCAIVFAGKITTPPPFTKINPNLQHWLYEVYQHFQILEVTTTNPDGSRNGKKGEMLHLQTGGKFYHCENTDGSTTWRAVELTDTP